MSKKQGEHNEDKGFKVKIGPPWLTKYEKARIIGIRALQISLGAPVLLPPSILQTGDPIVIAQKELEAGVLPILVIRWTPDGRVQEIPIKYLSLRAG
ncbi:MAG: DNA-directed RNA polymerase subunit K [Thermoprotei archaeon]|nr:MAG: DNA-directed RNA polymerase subunit K [Thermoprotei archaeon]